MKKTIAIVATVFLFVLAGCGHVSNYQEENVDLDNELITKLKKGMAEVSLLYADNYLRTNQLAHVARNSDFVSFQKYMDNLIYSWQKLETLSNELEALTEEITQENKINISFLETAYAYYDKDEITRMFDAAPAGRKIRTLAKKLNVSAKKAYSILKMSQAELEAEAWNQAGDTFENLENGAKAVKNGCKVGLMVGGTIATGGSGTVTTMSLLEKTTLIVNGADLVLEIGEDTANIALGYNNEATAVISDVRTLTKPATAILGVTNLYDADDTLDAFMFGLDQANAVINQGEVLGIKIKDGQKTIETNTIKKEDTEKWLEENKIPKKAAPKDISEKITEKKQEIIPELEEEPVEIGLGEYEFPEEEIVEEEDDENIVGTWTFVSAQAGAGGGDVSSLQTMYEGAFWTFNEDGSCSFLGAMNCTYTVNGTKIYVDYADEDILDIVLKKQGAQLMTVPNARVSGTLIFKK
jgi:hypothetical protein